LKSAARRFAVILIVVLVAASCAPDDLATRDVREAAVVIEAHGCSLVAARGTGVAIGRPGLVVTVAHTIAGATSIDVVDSAGSRRSAVVIWFDPAADLAVLEVPGVVARGLDLGRATPGGPIAMAAARPGEPIAGVAGRVNRFIAVTIEDIYVDEIVHRAAIELDLPVVKGDSGAAVVDPRGHVVGVIYARSRNTPHNAFALDDTEIARAIQSSTGGVVANGHCT